MATETGIEWTDHTFNPWIGCTKISPACDGCYAEALVKRWGGDFAELRRTAPANWQHPIRWNRIAVAAGVRRRVFCASLADVFDNQAPSQWRDDLWHRIDQTPALDWQLLTKRPQNIARMLPSAAIGTPDWGGGWSNVWLGTTVENQVEALRRVPYLRAVPAAVRFLSCEPLLEQVEPDLDGIDWVICGGESGPGARPMNPAWVRRLRDQCREAEVGFFFKQWGEWWPENGRYVGALRHQGERCKSWPADLEGLTEASWRIGKKKAGRILDGAVHDAPPAGRSLEQRA